MAQDVVRAVLRRQVNDPAFQARFAADPVTVLRGYDLTVEERRTLQKDLHDQLTAWGMTPAWGAVSAVSSPAPP